MLFAIGMYFNFLIGGISGVFLSDVPADTTEHGSFFVMAHFHYTIMGGLIFALFGGIYYWLPKMMGIKLNQTLGKCHFWTMFIFFNSTFLPLFAVGMAGQPRRVFEYARNLETLNDWVSISAFCLGVSILIFVINFVWSTLFARVREVGNPWNSRGLEWQIASPPPPGNFDRVPVVLSGPYEYGVKNAEPVADLSPPPGVLAATFTARRTPERRYDHVRHRPYSAGAQPDPASQEEAAFYHEAALNAAWTGSRLLIGSLSFGFGAFVFAFFYLKSLNSHGLWYPTGTSTFKPPQFGLGTTIMVLIVVSALVQWAGLTRIKAAQRNLWMGAAALALVLGVVAVCLQLYQLVDLPFWPGASGFASVFIGTSPVFAVIVLGTMVYLEILIMRCRAIPQISFVEQPPTFAEAFAVQRFQSALSGFTLVWNYLAVIAVVLWVLFYLVH